MKNTHILLSSILIISACGTQTLTVQKRNPAEVTPTTVSINENLDVRKMAHNALMEHFFPVNLPGKAQLSETLYQAFSQNAAMVHLHSALSNLNLLTTRASYPLGEAKDLIEADQKKLLDFLTTTNAVSFSELSEKQRIEFLNLFRDSVVQSRRAMFNLVKSAYMSSIYDSSFGEKIAGIKLPQKIRSDLNDYMKNNPLDLIQVKALKKYDAIVVGSGPAGSVVAHELQKKGKKVLLLESGSFVHPGTIDTKKFSEFRYSGTPNLFNHDSSIIFRAGSATGGGSAVNIDLAFSPELREVRAQIEKWRTAGFIDYDQYTAGEIKNAYSYITSKLGTRTPAVNEINANNDVLLKGARKTGSEARLYDLNSFSPIDARGKISDKRSSVEAFLIPAMKDKKNPLHFRPNASVSQVIFGEDGKTVRGVVVKMSKSHPVPGVIENPMGLNFPLETEIEILADKVILSAGAIGTPALLMKSGIQNPMLGKNIIAHPSMPIIGKFNRPINILEGTASTVYVPQNGYILESTSASPGYAAMMMPGTPREIVKNLENFNYYAGFGIMLVDESTTENKLLLDKNGMPIIHYNLTERDKKTFIRGITDAARIMFAAGATEVLLPSTEFPVLRSLKELSLLEKNLKLIKSKNIITSAHIQGTARMGKDPGESVIDTNQMVWGTRNLYVADSSIHPMSVGANPMQTIYTFAKIFADKFD